MDHGIGLIPTRIRLHAIHRIPLDAIRAFTPMSEHRFATYASGPPELEPEITPDEGLGWIEDAPRQPLPLAQVLANIARLKDSDNPTVKAKAGEFKRRDYDQAVAAYTAWEIRQ